MAIYMVAFPCLTGGLSNTQRQRLKEYYLKTKNIVYVLVLLVFQFLMLDETLS
jgi:hypothetical protein